MSHAPDTSKFQPGPASTLGALPRVTLVQIAAVPRRRDAGDWDEVGEEDGAANERALTHGERFLSVSGVNGERLWVPTEANRSAPTVLTSGEY